MHTKLYYTSMKKQKNKRRRRARVKNKIAHGKNLEKTIFPYTVLFIIPKEEVYVCAQVHYKLLDGRI